MDDRGIRSRNINVRDVVQRIVNSPAATLEGRPSLSDYEGDASSV